MSLARDVPTYQDAAAGVRSHGIDRTWIGEDAGFGLFYLVLPAALPVATIFTLRLT